MKLILDFEGMLVIGVFTSCSVFYFSPEWSCVDINSVVLLLCRSRSRSRSPSYSRRHARGGHSDDLHRGKLRTPRIEYITEFGGTGDGDAPKLEGFSPPPSPTRADVLNRSGHWTFNSCKDRLDSLYSAAAYPHIVA